jgi:signal transduction histidine kinase
MSLSTAFCRYRLLLLLLVPGSSINGQAPPARLPLDSLITRIPVMMRSNEAVARRQIEELTARAAAETHRHGVVQAAFFRCWLSYRHEPPDRAIAGIDSAIRSITGIGNDTALVKFYILKGQCFVKKAQFGKALENFTTALNVANKRGDKSSRNSILISIGWAYMEDAKPKEAIRFFKEALQLEPSEGFAHRAVLLCNIAACYNTIGDFRLAETYARQGIEAARRRESNADLANGLNILARSYYRQGKRNTAITTLKEAAAAREKVADPSMLASDYLALADLYNKNGQPQEALAWAKKAEVVSIQTGNNLKVSATYETLADAYETIGDHKNATLYMRKLLAHKDSLANDRYSQAFAEMQVQFESQKRAAENLQLKKENLETRLKNSNQQRWLVALAAGLLLLAASAVYVSRLVKSRYHTRLALEQVNEQKRRTLAVMEAEERERRRIAGDLHDGVGQTLAAASLQLTKARKEALLLNKVEELINQAGEEVRHLSHQVTPVLLQHYGLAKAIQQAIDRLNEANDRVVFTLFTHLEEAIGDEMVELTVYRCFQELCNNVLKHADASKVSVQLTTDPEGVQLMVEDNGKGFSVNRDEQGLGIKNMRGRLAIYDGELIVDSTPGKGTTTILRLQRAAWEKAGAKTV